MSYASAQRSARLCLAPLEISHTILSMHLSLSMMLLVRRLWALLRDELRLRETTGDQDKPDEYKRASNGMTINAMVKANTPSIARVESKIDLVKFEPLWGSTMSLIPLSAFPPLFTSNGASPSTPTAMQARTMAILEILPTKVFIFTIFWLDYGSDTKRGNNMVILNRCSKVVVVGVVLELRLKANCDEKLNCPRHFIVKNTLRNCLQNPENFILSGAWIPLIFKSCPQFFHDRNAKDSGCSKMFIVKKVLWLFYFHSGVREMFLCTD